MSNSKDNGVAQVDEALEQRTPSTKPQELKASLLPRRQDNMKTYRTPPEYPNDPQQWGKQHDIRMFLEQAIDQAEALSWTLRELVDLQVVDPFDQRAVDKIVENLEAIYNGEEEI